MKYEVAIILLVCGVLLQQYVECKRAGGGGGSSRGSSGRGSIWGNYNQKSAGSGIGASAAVLASAAYGQNYNPQYPQQRGYNLPSHANPNIGGGMFGYGGMGGIGGMGMGGFRGGYGGMMGPKRSVATGLLVWSVMHDGRLQYYNVYNHYNHPEAVPQEIALPANILTLCPERATVLCAPNTVPLCTTNKTILCAVSATATIPCENNAAASCVNTSPPCIAGCEVPVEDTTLILPCIANATVSGQVNLASENQEDMTMSLFPKTSQNADMVLCITTMAMAVASPGYGQNYNSRYRQEQGYNPRTYGNPYGGDWMPVGSQYGGRQKVNPDE